MDLRKVLEQRILDEMSREELLAVEDVERVTARTKEGRTKNKAKWKTHTGVTPTEEDRGRRVGAHINS